MSIHILFHDSTVVYDVHKNSRVSFLPNDTDQLSPHQNTFSTPLTMSCFPKILVMVVVFYNWRKIVKCKFILTEMKYSKVNNQVRGKSRT